MQAPNREIVTSYQPIFKFTSDELRMVCDVCDAVTADPALSAQAQSAYVRLFEQSEKCSEFSKTRLALSKQTHDSQFLRLPWIMRKFGLDRTLHMC